MLGYMKQTKSGFTIVELMVVIVIIAIIAGLVTIGYQRITERSNDNALRNDLTHAAEDVSAWLLDHSMAELVAIYSSKGGYSAAWIVGEEADNDLSSSQIRWNDIEGMPNIQIGSKATVEVIGRYTSGDPTIATATNNFMQQKNMFCITGAVKDGTYNYRPMSGEPEKYDKLLFYDSAIERVVTMNQLAEAQDDGQQIACRVHLERWRDAT